MSEPFADPSGSSPAGETTAVRSGCGRGRTPRLFERNAIPTMALYGPDDHVIWRRFPEMCEVAFSELIGPFVVNGAGHFLQWERAQLLNKAIEYFLGELRSQRPAQPPNRGQVI